MKKFLLICLLVVIIVVSVAVGINLYQKKMMEDNRRAVLADMKQLATKALEYYNAPLQIGGGDGNWVPLIDGEYITNRCALWLNFSGLIKMAEGDFFFTDNGSFKLWVQSPDDKTLKILGTGVEMGKDGLNPVQVRLDVNGPTKGISIVIMN